MMHRHLEDSAPAWRAARFAAAPLGLMLVLVALGAGFPQAAHAQQADLAILSCSIVDGPTPDTVDLVLQAGVLTPQTGFWEVPIDIFLDGVRVDPQHKLTYEKVFLQACQQNPPDCGLPFPCGFTKWSYKGRGPFFENWRCLQNGQTHACDCVDPGLPVAHKTVPRPPTSSFFDVFVDLDNVFPEPNEENNHCRVFYAGPVPAIPMSWGGLKATYYR